MKKFKVLMKKYVNMDYDELVVLAKTSLGECRDLLTKVDPKYNGAIAVVTMVNASLMADGKLSAKEIRFLRDVMGMEEDDVKTLVSRFTGKEYEVIDMMADLASVEEKMAIINFIATIAACDEKISAGESAFLLKIIE